MKKMAFLLSAVVMASGCSLAPGKCGDCQFFSCWPEGKDPATISRRLTDLFLSTSPDSYKPQGYASPQGYAKNGYGNGKNIHYSVVALWINAMECARITGDKDREQKLIAAFEPYFGEKAWVLPKFKHVDFTIVGSVPLEIAILNGDARAKALGLKYADMQWEKPKEDDPPPLYNKPSFEERMKWWSQGYTCQTRLWIDDMYMITVLQSQAYRLTKDRKYIDRAAKEMCLYLDEIQVKDGKDAGLFYHAPDVPFYWGRGDGWMAVGLTEVLDALPKDSPYYKRIMKGYRKMMKSLLRYRNEEGLWNQLIDQPDFWTETSGSAMFTYAFIRGVKKGWLPASTYAPAARKAWLALIPYINSNDDVTNICVGTGKKNDFNYYLDRPKMTGDYHGQGPYLWCAAALMENERMKE